MYTTFIKVKKTFSFFAKWWKPIYNHCVADTWLCTELHIVEEKEEKPTSDIS